MHLRNDITQNVLSLQKHVMEATVRSDTPDQYFYNTFLKASANTLWLKTQIIWKDWTNEWMNLSSLHLFSVMLRQAVGTDTSKSDTFMSYGGVAGFLYLVLFYLKHVAWHAFRVMLQLLPFISEMCLVHGRSLCRFPSINRERGINHSQESSEINLLLTK